MERINKYWIVLLAVLLGLLFPVSTAEAKNFVVVRDAGHGGKDHGALGKRSNEKSINLAVALLLGEKIEDNCKDVDVVYTRKSDKFVSLQGRADIANKEKRLTVIDPQLPDIILAVLIIKEIDAETAYIRV